MYGKTVGYYTRYRPWMIARPFDSADPYNKKAVLINNRMAPRISWTDSFVSGDEIKFNFDFDTWDNHGNHQLYMSKGKINQDHYMIIQKVG